MPLELRPGWCLSDDEVSQVLTIGDWRSDGGHKVSDLDGDDWKPGETVALHRSVSLEGTLIDLRRGFGLPTGQSAGLAAAWKCSATAVAGVHVGGPAPVPITQDLESLVLEVPQGIGGSLELEMCIVSLKASGKAKSAIPVGAVLWSDSWTTPNSDRTLLLEGDETRLPVRTVSFQEYFGQASSALWAIDLDTTIESDDLIANVALVLLNKDVLEREFRDTDGQPDAARLPPSALAGISVDLVRTMTAVMLDDFDASDDWAELAPNTVGATLVLRLTESFGSVDKAQAAYENDQPTFCRELWNRFAPNAWGAEK